MLGNRKNKGKKGHKAYQWLFFWTIIGQWVRGLLKHSLSEKQCRNIHVGKNGFVILLGASRRRGWNQLNEIIKSQVLENRKLHTILCNPKGNRLPWQKIVSIGSDPSKITPGSLLFKYLHLGLQLTWAYSFKSAKHWTRGKDEGTVHRCSSSVMCLLPRFF